jgi:hypothetical protein
MVAGTADQLRGAENGRQRGVGDGREQVGGIGPIRLNGSVGGVEPESRELAALAIERKSQDALFADELCEQRSIHFSHDVRSLGATETSLRHRSQPTFSRRSICISILAGTKTMRSCSTYPKTFLSSPQSAASLEVSRHARRAKSDALDVDSLLRHLMAYGANRGRLAIVRDSLLPEST